MATVKLVKLAKGKLLAAALQKAKLGDTDTNFTILDSQDGHYTVHGHTASGKDADISAVATLTATSDNPAVFTASTPVGMSGDVTAVAAGTANLILVATWTDGSVGPFTITVPGTVNPTPDPVTGLGVLFGTPTIH